MTERGRLTPHQTEVLARIERRAKYQHGHGVRETDIGSRGAVQKLIDKGWVAVVTVEHGPRGGQVRRLAPIALPIPCRLCGGTTIEPNPSRPEEEHFYCEACGVTTAATAC